MTKEEKKQWNTKIKFDIRFAWGSKHESNPFEKLEEKEE